MADQHQNIDEQLTADFGALMDGTLAQDSINDPLMPVLNRFKEERFEPLEDSGKQQVWAMIDKEISGPAKIHQLEAKRNIKAWLVAASVLIVSFIGLYAVFTDQSPKVLLQTYADSGEITLKDGSEVILRPYSTLTELSYSGDQQEYSLDGEGFFSVVKNADREFKVTAGNGTVTVLGTRFNLSSWDEHTEVYLEEGSVRFESAVTSSGVILQPGESAQTIGRGAVIRNEQADAREYNDWRNNQLIFTNKEVSSIIAELEQHFNIVIRVPDALQSVTLSGGLTLDSPEQSLEYLALTLDGDFVKITDMEYRFTPATE